VNNYAVTKGEIKKKFLFHRYVPTYQEKIVNWVVSDSQAVSCQFKPHQRFLLFSCAQNLTLIAYY